MKYILIIILTFSITLETFCQLTYGPSIFGGASALMSTREGPRTGSEYSWEYKGSFAVGGFVNYKLNQTIGMKMNLLYNQHNYYEGFKIDEGLSSYRGYNTFRKSHYLSIPLMVQFKLKKIKLNLGAQYSYLFNQQVSGNSFGFPNSPAEFEYKGFNDLLKNNIELIGSVAYQISDNFNIEIRYLLGFINLMNYEAGHVYEANSSQILLGLNYNLRGFNNEKDTSKP